MAQHRLGIIMNGVTGRMGMNQHLIRSIIAIRAQGGVPLMNGDRVMPDPILVGRNAEKLEGLAKSHGITRWTTDLDAALKNPDDTLFFDAATTQLRAQLLRKAMAAGKHIYCEKPVADNLNDALDLVRVAKRAGIKHGVVQDKLFLPGLRKLKLLVDSGFFGRILTIRGEFGYWVFEGGLQPAQQGGQLHRLGDDARSAIAPRGTEQQPILQPRAHSTKPSSRAFDRRRQSGTLASSLICRSHQRAAIQSDRGSR